jgi:predicted anti-sigma-YlaC factor YlaD
MIIGEDGHIDTDTFVAYTSLDSQSNFSQEDIFLIEAHLLICEECREVKNYLDESALRAQEVSSGRFVPHVLSEADQLKEGAKNHEMALRIHSHARLLGLIRSPAGHPSTQDLAVYNSRSAFHLGSFLKIFFIWIHLLRCEECRWVIKEIQNIEVISHD